MLKAVKNILVAASVSIAGFLLMWFLFHKAAATKFSTTYVNTFTSLLLILGFVFAVGGLTAAIASLFFPSRLRNLLLLLTSLFLALSIAELAVRLSDSQKTYLEQRDNIYRSYYDMAPTAGWYLAWDTGRSHYMNSPEFKYWRPTNEHGMGDYSFDSLSRLDGVKIMAMGDSFTEGDGAPYDSSWVKQLERILNENRSGKPVITMNAGICANDPVFSVFQFKNELLRYRPHIAILCMNDSDIHDIKARGGFDRFRPDSTVVYSGRPWWEPFYAINHLFRLFTAKMLGLDFNFYPEKKFNESIPAFTDSLKHTANLFAELCDLNSIAPVIVFLPLKGELSKDEYTPYCAAAVEKLGRLPNAVFIDVLDFYRRKWKGSATAKELYWEHDNHLNSLGYKMVAEAIEEKIRDLPQIKAE